MTIAMKVAIITFPSHSGVLPGFLQENTCITKFSYQIIDFDC